MVAGGAATLVIFLFVTSAGAAAAKLTDFNGSWNGIGTDRASPLEVSQPTSCHASIRADETTLNDEIICEGKAGLHKTISLTVHLSDNRISGTLTQTSTTRGSKAHPSRFGLRHENRQRRELPSAIWWTHTDRDGCSYTEQPIILLHAGQHVRWHTDGGELRSSGQS
jgi:hypothetical protein